jgi:DnaJ-class molecular chaperone with C-terminal Zn finger domain
LDPYLELGVPGAASTSEITDAYDRLVRQYHPDTAPQGRDGKVAEGPLFRVMAAYKILENPGSRNTYDRHHPAPCPRSLHHLPTPVTWIGPPDSPRVTPALRVTPVRWHERV